MFLENAGLALESLRANKMRAALTMLGIIIGISSVIAIVTIGNAVTSQVTKQMQSFGTSNINVWVIQRGEGGNYEPDDSDLITNEMIQDLRERFENKISGISVSYSGGSATARDGGRYANVSIRGINQDYQMINNIEITEGRFVTEQDIQAYRSIAVVSDKFVSKIFGNSTDPIGKEIKLFSGDDIEVFTIVGVYKYEAGSLFGGTASNDDVRTEVYVPITTSKLAAKYKNHMSITVMADAETDSAAFTDELITYFEKVYANNSKWEVFAASLEAQVESVSKILGYIQLAVSVIAAISLLVGGIGVMNIMLVSVTERTREVGTRKALGAKNYHIRMQFVVEAVIISLLGGIIGIALGLLIGMTISYFLKTTATASPEVILISVVFSMAIGVFFGYYPANKAAKLDPIEALRYE